MYIRSTVPLDRSAVSDNATDIEPLRQDMIIIYAYQSWGLHMYFGQLIIMINVLILEHTKRLLISWCPRSQLAALRSNDMCTYSTYRVRRMYVDPD